MKTTNLQRSAWILPIARNHGTMLRCAELGWKAIRAIGTERVLLIAEMRTMCNDEILEFLEDEQWVLSPVIGDRTLRDEMHKRHSSLRALLVSLSLLPASKTPGSELVVRISRQLQELVRWEEHELFPRIEENLGAEQVRRLERLTGKIQQRRTPLVPLVRRSNSRIEIDFDLNSSTLMDNLQGAGTDSRYTSDASRAAGIRDVTSGIYAFDDDFRGTGGSPSQ